MRNLLLVAVCGLLLFACAGGGATPHCVVTEEIHRSVEYDLSLAQVRANVAAYGGRCGSLGVFRADAADSRRGSLEKSVGGGDVYLVCDFFEYRPGRTRMDIRVCRPNQRRAEIETIIRAIPQAEECLDLSNDDFLGPRSQGGTMDEN